jgi:two-component system sensor histidine kinase KdpD
VELAPDLPLVRMDAPLIEQCLENLLENAVRHTPRGTIVRLSARTAGHEMVISVEDYGGASPEQLERLFAKFQHAKGEAATRGIGLGLAICRSIMTLHGGRIWAEAVAGGGTAFRFALPLESVPVTPPEPVLR